MIKRTLQEYKGRVTIVPLRDNLYSDSQWIITLNNIINSATGGSNSVTLVGHKKDKTSFYLDYFPQWKFEEVGNYFSVNATEIREAIFNGTEIKNLPDHIRDYLDWHMKNNAERYENLKDERGYLSKYKASWSGTPHPVTFITTDVVLIKSGHILLIKLKVNPGNGKFALPGGFLDVEQTLVDSALRELKEETKIDIPKAELRKAIKAQKIFDHPDRSMRGRTITTAFLINLEGGNLPAVKGGDDAAEALWVPLSDIALYEEDFFEDHVHIIRYFVGKV
jgi:bifunctional NMN adenylyltransferase/nudix hydrolase